jgi:hypothetical protein
VTTPRFGHSARSLWSAPRCGFRVLLVGLLLSLACLGQTPSASAQSKHAKPYALIFGTVWGPDNRPVYGVKVKIRRADQKKARWEQYSDHSGEFAQRVPEGPGDYVVWADLKGYKSNDGRHLQPSDEVEVHIDNDERADIGLHLK